MIEIKKVFKKNLHLLPYDLKNGLSESDYFLSENIIPDDINNKSNANIIDKDFGNLNKKLKILKKNVQILIRNQ